ncbi:MAG: GTPase [Candidatus Hodarchaeales archaeon]|jgi:GTP-binding protein EngB required for normal cell division
MKNIYNIPVTGRPNAGKTTIINYLTHSRRPVGKKAGTTLRIAPVQLVKDVFLVDLPGFGRITKRSKSLEDIIKDQIVKFLEDPSSSILFGIHVIDSSTFHIVTQSLEKKGIIPIDIEMIQFLEETTKHPPIVLMNKIDKVNTALFNQNVDILSTYDLPRFEVFPTSFKTKNGCREFRNMVRSLIVENLGVQYQNWSG